MSGALLREQTGPMMSTKKKLPAHEKGSGIAIRLGRQDGGLRRSLPSGRASHGPGGLQSALAPASERENHTTSPSAR
jgi:hypothetical protein